MESRRFTAEFRREAVKLAMQAGVSTARVAEKLEIHAKVLTRRIREV
jgi:transposase-like protein